MAGFTMIELLFVIGTLAVVAMLAMTPPRGCGARSSRIFCTSNLKQIGLAFRMYANDHGERFPMEVTVVEDGTKEIPLKDLALASFTSISNELNNPKPLTCRSDSERERTNDFTQLSVRNISYFLGPDVLTGSPLILAGDRNLGIGGIFTNGLIEISNPKLASWSARIHANEGNVVLGDGSAHQLDNRLLQNTLSTGLLTNRFLIP